MLISMNWISEYTDLTGINLKELINRFTLSTAEVEGTVQLGSDISDVVVGEIKEVLPHPDSDKLHLLKINIGDKELVPCVCGADNIFVGAYVPFAKAGGMVQGNKIQKSKVAGYESRGMCCSEKELGISEENDGVLIFDHSHEPGTDLLSFLPLADTIFEVDNKSLTNRPDLWGIYGIAREIAALNKRPLKPLSLADITSYANLPEIPVQIDDKDKVFRYSCVKIGSLTQKMSPLWMKIRLTYCGMRPINLLADLTNYIMLELGQPMHAFDADILFDSIHTKENRILVKTMEQPIPFTTLDGSSHTVDTNTLMICSQKGPAAIAGIMGGELSQISDTTSTVVIESANFDAVSVRKSAVRLNLRTDASAHYEKTLDPEMTFPAIQHFIKLVNELDPNAKILSNVTDVYVKKYPTVVIDFDKAYVDRCTGIDISSDQIEETLCLLGFGVTRSNDDFHVVVPSYRSTKDVTIKADIIEEICRIYGYDNFSLTSQSCLLEPVLQIPAHIDEYELKVLLASRYHMNEVHTYLWYDSKRNKELGIIVPQNVKIINSVAADCEMIQSSIIPNLLYTVKQNADSYPEQKLFNISRVVDGYQEDGLCKERKKLGIVLASKDKKEKELFYQLKGILEDVLYELKHTKLTLLDCKDHSDKYNYLHPVNCASLTIEETEIGYISCIHPQVQNKINNKMNLVFAEVDMDTLSELSKQTVEYEEPSKYPNVTIDLSLLLPNKMKYNVIDTAVSNSKCSHLNNYTLIDTYEDPDTLGDQKVYTLRFTFVSKERTLTSEEITEQTNRILSSFKDAGIKLR